MITESATVKVFGQGINQNSPRVPDASSPPFAHMIVGRVIISMKALHDCRTESPVSIAQGSFSCSLEKVNQGLRLGLGFASLPPSRHRQNRASSKLYSKVVAKLAPVSAATLVCTDSLHHTVKNRLDHIPELFM